MTDEQARNLAYGWHGGMLSPLYAFASSGLVKSVPQLRNEIRDCTAFCSPKDRRELESLLVYIDANVQKTPEGAFWPWHFAPWARKENTCAANTAETKPT